MTKTRIALLSFSVLAQACVAREHSPNSDASSGPDSNVSTGDVAPPAPPAAAPSATTATTAVPGGCPQDVPAAVQIATEPAAMDLQIVGGRVYYRHGSVLVQVNLDGSAAREVVSSQDHYYASATMIYGLTSKGGASANEWDTVEANGNVTKTTGSISSACCSTPPPPTPSIAMFGEAAGEFYVMQTYPGGTFTNSQEQKFVEPAQTTMWRDSFDGKRDILLSAPGTDYTDARLGPHGVVGVVAHGKDVLAIDASASQDTFEPKLLATIDGCRLALGTSHAFCSTPSAVFTIDLAGGAPASKLLDRSKSKSAASFGAAFADEETLFVASKDPSSDPMKHVLRELRAGEPAVERLLACGRDAITSVAFDSGHVVFSEAGRGVFVVTR